MVVRLVEHCLCAQKWWNKRKRRTVSFFVKEYEPHGGGVDEPSSTYSHADPPPSLPTFSPSPPVRWAFRCGDYSADNGTDTEACSSSCGSGGPYMGRYKNLQLLFSRACVHSAKRRTYCNQVSVVCGMANVPASVAIDSSLLSCK